MWPWFVLAAALIALVVKSHKEDKDLLQLTQDEKDAEEGLNYIKNYLAESRA